MFKSGEIFGPIINRLPGGMVEVDYDGTVLTMPEIENEYEVNLFPEDNATVKLDSKDYIGQEEADKLFESWQRLAREAKALDNKNKVIISLFDFTGNWASPFSAAGYTCISIDIQHDSENLDIIGAKEIYEAIISGGHFSAGVNLMQEFPGAMFEFKKAIDKAGMRVVGILAAPPCTTFAASGASHWPTHDRFDEEEVEKRYGEWASRHFNSPNEYNQFLVAVTMEWLAFFKPDFYAMENPVGRLKKQMSLPEPLLSFNPNNFGQPYTKKTFLWGKFYTDLPLANVAPTQGSLTRDKMSSRHKVRRSETPIRFAYSFFVAQHTAYAFSPIVKEDTEIDVVAQYMIARHAETQVKIKKRIAEVRAETGTVPKRVEIEINKDIKSLAIQEQNKSGVRENIISWAKNKANNVVIIVAFSGGKDSTALVLNLLKMGFDKSQIELWHHDVDGDGENLFDWKCTVSYCKAFAKAFGIPILFSYAGGGIRREIFRENETIQPIYFQEVENGEFKEKLPDPIVKVHQKGEKKGQPKTPEEIYKDNTRLKFPAVMGDLSKRWCSWIAKIAVMNKAINNIPRFDNANILILTGERRSESNTRALYLEFEPYRSYSQKRKAITWRAIADWSEQQVWDIIKEYKVQPHPCYELGWGRCSCQLCIFSTSNHWAAINELNPEKVREIAAIETKINHVLYDGMTIMSKVERGESFLKADKRARWESEAKGEFTSPIFIDNWTLPMGAFSKESCGAT